MLLIGIAVFLFCTGLTLTVLGSQLSNFLSLPNLMFILVPLVAIMVSTKSLKVFTAGLSAVINPKRHLSEEMRGQAASLFRFLSKTAAMVSAIAVFISLLNMLMILDFIDPDARRNIGPNVAASLVPLGYGLFLIAAVFEPVVYNLKKRRDSK